jgi:hypothetical protein
LSANKSNETEGGQHPERSSKTAGTPAGGRKQRSGDLGRALRSVYDDTLRESVPDDFMDLIKKLG